MKENVHSSSGKKVYLMSVRFKISKALNRLFYIGIRFLTESDSRYIAVVWNPWEKKARALTDLGDDEYKHMLCVDGAAIEKPITLKPGEEWTGKLNLSVVLSTWKPVPVISNRFFYASLIIFWAIFFCIVYRTSQCVWLILRYQKSEILKGNLRFEKVTHF